MKTPEIGQHFRREMGKHKLKTAIITGGVALGAAVGYSYVTTQSESDQDSTPRIVSEVTIDGPYGFAYAKDMLVSGRYPDGLAYLARIVLGCSDGIGPENTTTPFTNISGGTSVQTYLYPYDKVKTNPDLNFSLCDGPVPSNFGSPNDVPLLEPASAVASEVLRAAHKDISGFNTTVADGVSGSTHIVTLDAGQLTAYSLSMIKSGNYPPIQVSNQGYQIDNEALFPSAQCLPAANDGITLCNVNDQFAVTGQGTH